MEICYRELSLGNEWERKKEPYQTWPQRDWFNEILFISKGSSVLLYLGGKNTVDNYQSDLGREKDWEL